ncbi:carboxymuconolactone decarboxylase family protein [Mycobacterium sp. SMC-4]|uniref:carboxymuconolactone decarboxylase family protein n=1 Tax=Mycobacterium sp. SMC-4 TaxID=2857059 RepID=UPI0021B481D7|nr:carboxymuconolactone decarboxylase family protein [Mycobacterium sp. SMC-4]UXA16337.1 carboxymuconolactone decarboxylase family protein [Mycobacterium sp. SMC-4]
MTDSAVPELLAQLVALSSGDPHADTLIRLTCGRTLSLPPLPMPGDVVDELSAQDRVLAGLAEQFCVDVTGIGDQQRQHFLETFGDRAFRTVLAVFVADFVPRVWAGCAALGLGTPGQVTDVAWQPETDPAEVLLAGFVPAVARLRELDAVTTEVVRLRGAAAHNCRLCKSLREGHALDAGGSEDLYGQIADYEKSELLSGAHKAALRYVDALVWTPSRIDEAVVAGMHTHFSGNQQLEITLDVMRNAANKIMVSLGADAPRVTEGTERYEVDETGQTIFA